MPCYNEAYNIERAIEQVSAHVFACVADAELVIVDDGSSDATAAIARRWSEHEPRMRVIAQQNEGHGPALVNGIRASRGARCLLVDSDRQIGLQNFDETWLLAREHDAVLGVRSPRRDPLHRRVLSAGLRGWLALALRVRAADPNAPYKLVSRAALLEAIDAMPARPLIPSILLCVHLMRSGARIAEQRVPHFARVAGKSSLRLRRLLVFCGRAFVELMRFNRRMGRAR